MSERSYRSKATHIHTQCDKRTESTDLESRTNEFGEANAFGGEHLLTLSRLQLICLQ